MNLEQAKTECQRWLDYLERQKAKSVEIQQIASDRRTGRCDEAEGRRRLSAIDGRAPKVYDGAKLAEAVAFLLKRT
jgi:hypothetical protein